MSEFEDQVLRKFDALQTQLRELKETVAREFDQVHREIERLRLDVRANECNVEAVSANVFDAARVIREVRDGTTQLLNEVHVVHLDHELRLKALEERAS